MSILAGLLVIVLGALALIHTLWGFGLWLPQRDEAKLVKAVVGGRGVTRMPGPIPCGLVAATMLVVIGAILGRGNPIADAVLWLAAVVFALRGALIWLPIWRKVTPQEPFATYDRRYYGPLCLAIAAGLTALVL